MKKLIDINTGEYLKNFYYDNDDNLKKIVYEEFDCIFNIGIDEIEVVKYKEPFKVPRHLVVDDDFAANYITDPELSSSICQQKFKNLDGIAVPVSPNVRISDLIKSVYRSSKRSKKRFYDYAMANEWQYFCTWTFSDENIRTDKDLIYLSWDKFLQKIRKQNPDVQAIATYESFENEENGMHMHALFNNCVFNLRPAISEGKFIYSSYRNQIFNCIDWTNGFSTVVCIDPKSVKAQIVNYLGKYMTKECPAPYRCKRYFHTQNLDCRKTFMLKLEKQDMNELIRQYINTNIDLTTLKPDNFDDFLNGFALRKVKEKNNIIVYKADFNNNLIQTSE